MLDELKAAGNYRTVPTSVQDGLTDFSTNDYLGLAGRTDLQAAFFDNPANRHIAMTSSASRLLAANQDEYTRLEQSLSELYGRDILLFNSGYHANAGLMSALADKHTLIVADKLVHASIIDGIILSKSKFTRFRHNDYNHLEQLLKREAPNYERVIIAVESVYSMDGDRADIDRLAQIKSDYENALLYVDEAHALGVEGRNGLGLCLTSEFYGLVDVAVGTFGKAAASYGAFCAVSPTLRNVAVNRARSFIFSTALPPITCAWTRFIMERLTDMNKERKHLHNLATRLHDALTDIGMASTSTEPSHIQPVIIGDAHKVVELSKRLLNDGVKVLPIRTPTVPPGTERLRISLSAAMSHDDIDLLTDSLRRNL